VQNENQFSIENFFSPYHIVFFGTYSFWEILIFPIIYNHKMRMIIEKKLKEKNQIMEVKK
jgi:hypothetical protein